MCRPSAVGAKISDQIGTNGSYRNPLYRLALHTWHPFVAHCVAHYAGGYHAMGSIPFLVAAADPGTLCRLCGVARWLSNLLRPFSSSARGCSNDSKKMRR